MANESIIDADALELVRARTMGSERRLDAKLMKAPNGEMSLLSEFQWLLVRTPQFKQWFGDWESKSAPPRFQSSNPGGGWLEAEREKVKAEGLNGWGTPTRYGPVTASFNRDVMLPVSLLKDIRGLRNEQSKVRHKDFSAICRIAEQTGRFPLLDKDRVDGATYNPFVMVMMDGTPWMMEGNHRIMVAAECGWDFVPVELRYFSGGELENGLLTPRKVMKFDHVARNLGRTPLYYGAHRLECSALLDVNGEPQVYFHGTRVSHIVDFQPSENGSLSGGVYFTANRDEALFWANGANNAGVEDGTDVAGPPRIEEVFLNVRKIDPRQDELTEFGGELVANQYFDWQEQGYDGAQTHYGFMNMHELAVANPAQVLSAAPPCILTNDYGHYAAAVPVDAALLSIMPDFMEELGEILKESADELSLLWLGQLVSIQKDGLHGMERDRYSARVAFSILFSEIASHVFSGDAQVGGNLLDWFVEKRQVIEALASHYRCAAQALELVDKQVPAAFCSP